MTANRIVVAIHQPTFLPWLGLFEKMAKSDIFVYLDDVQLPKKGGSWVNRNLIAIPGKKIWATVPIRRIHGETIPICNVLIDNEKPWRENYLNQIRENYRKHQNFEAIYFILKNSINKNWVLIEELNMHLVLEMMEILQIKKPQIIRSSDLGVESFKTERIVQIIQKVGGDHYLSGIGSSNYLDVKLLEESRINISYTQSHKIEYPQLFQKTFLKGLSIVDVLMNCENRLIKQYVS